MTYKRFEEIRTDNPDPNLFESMKARIIEEEQNDENQNKKDYNGLWEVYYYLFYGLYSAAWKAIHNLKEKHRWMVPATVYHSLEKILNAK